MGACHRSRPEQVPRTATCSASASPVSRQLAVDRTRTPRSPGTAQRAHGVCHREQRRLRAHEGAVLGVRGCRFDNQSGEANHLQPIDPIFLGLSIGATFLARGFSGDKRQLVPIFRAAMDNRGFSIIDVISPCVTFNDHEGSTKSYLFTRQHDVQMASPTSCRRPTRSRQRFRARAW